MKTIKTILKEIREERKKEPIWEKTICIECLDRIEEKINKANLLKQEERLQELRQEIADIFWIEINAVDVTITIK